MALDLSFLGSHRSSVAVRRTNAAGRAVEVFPDLLTTDESAAAHAVLRSYGAERVQEEYWVVRFAEGARVYVSTHAGLEPWSVELRACNEPIVRFLFELAQAGAFLVVHEDGVFTTSDGALERLRAHEVLATFVASPAELGAIIQTSWATWVTSRLRSD